MGALPPAHGVRTCRARGRHARRPSAPSSPTTASGSPPDPSTDSSRRSSRVAPCSTSGSIRCRSSRWCSVRPDRVIARGTQGVHRRRRADVGGPRVRRRRPRGDQHDAGEQDPMHGLDRRDRGAHRDRRHVLCAERVHAHPLATATRDRREFPFEGHGLRMQAAEVARCVRAGLTESPVLPHAEILSIMQTMDEIRRQIGLVYPASTEPVSRRSRASRRATCSAVRLHPAPHRLAARVQPPRSPRTASATRRGAGLDRPRRRGLGRFPCGSAGLPSRTSTKSESGRRERCSERRADP